MAQPLANYPLLKQILPEAYEYRICQFKESEKEESSEPATKFEATIRMKIKTKAEAKSWIKDLERTSAVTWRVDKTYPICGGKKTQNVYRIDMRCQHRTYSRSPTADKKASSKNTCCPAKMFLVVKRTHMASGKLSQSTDEYLQEFPTRVYLDFKHNHKLLSPEILRKRDVSEETVQKLTELYKAGHTPLSALEVIKHDLQEEYRDQYVFVAADRSKCPDKQFCYRLYYKLFCPKYPKSFGKKMLLELQGHLKPFCEKYDSHCASIEKTEDDNVIIAICSPRPRLTQNENSEENEQGNILSMPQVTQRVDKQSYSPQMHIVEQFHSQDSCGQAIGQCAEGLKTVFDDLLFKLESSPDIYLKPIETFLKNFQDIQKDDDLVNALQTFGQYSNVAMAISSTLKRQHSGDSSKVDPTTIICAKKKKGARRRLITARPVNHQTMLHPENNNCDGDLLIHEVSAHDLAVHEVSAQAPAHEVLTHEVSNHDVLTHEVSAHQITHEITSHEMSTHDISAHEISTHNVSAHEISTHEISAHHIPAHHIPANHVSTHHVPTHHISTHHISAHHVPAHTIHSHEIHLHPSHTICAHQERS
nr:uncharacterized protein LOC123773718 isoform X1 [Procambarus clarkii]